MEGIAMLAGFAAPYFDREGVLVLGPTPDIEQVPTVRYEQQDVIRQSRIVDQNLLDAPNVYVVQGSDASFAPIGGVAQVPATFPHSVANRGGRQVVKVMNVQGVLSSAQAQRLANTAAQTAFESFETVEFSSLVNTLHDAYSIVQLAGQNYREAGWEIELEPTAGMTMRHRLQRGEIRSER
jgi:hypothetical protein